jgi:hypothetical protein
MWIHALLLTTNFADSIAFSTRPVVTAPIQELPFLLGLQHLLHNMSAASRLPSREIGYFQTGYRLSMQAGARIVTDTLLCWSIVGPLHSHQYHHLETFLQYNAPQRNV